MLSQEAQAKKVATHDGTPLRVLDADDLSKGAVIEITCDTDDAAGPNDLEDNEPRVFIVTKEGRALPDNHRTR